MAPDGTERLVMAINGQYPGPTLHASKFLGPLPVQTANLTRLG
jgi:hypothetical protein